jgi:acyl-CoA synthetase (AMP-forming)/AMP-acid ligase II
MIFRSPYPDVAIPDLPLASFLLRQADRLARKPALIDGVTRQTYTYGEVQTAVDRIAAGLARRGFRKGDVLALYCPGSPEYVLALLATWRLGGATTTINPLYTAGELAYQLKDAGAVYVLTTPELLPRVTGATAEQPLRELFVFGEAAGATPFATLLAETGEPPAVTINPRQDTAVLLYSSGTTGFPKGVMLTHRNVIANIVQAQPLMHAGESDVLINALPFFHIAAWVVLFHMGMYHGGTIVTLPRFDLEQFLRTVQEYRVTRTLLVPPIVLALAKQPAVDAYDVSSLKVIIVGAAPLAESVGRACSERVGCLVQQVYGLTETSPLTHMNPEDPARLKLSSVGTCVPNTECKVVDLASGEELGPNQTGELWVRGPQVMRGYLHRSDATAQAINAQGWMRTGDVGYADVDGHFYIVDRVKELIKYKAFQVAPAELEAALLAHPAVADAAVIPSPDEEAGEVPKAFVVLKGEATPDELIAFVAERVAPYKKIRRLEVIDQIPKTASGKILRRVLIERERAAVAG